MRKRQTNLVTHRVTAKSTTHMFLCHCKKREGMSSPGNPLVESNSQVFCPFFANVARPPRKNRRCSPINTKTQLTLAAHSSPLPHSSGPLTSYRAVRVSFDLAITNSRQQNPTRKSSQTILLHQSRSYTPRK